jgi:hypothetical protein
LNNKTRIGIVLGIKSQGSRGVCGGIITIDAWRQCFAAQINSAQVIGGRGSEAGKFVVSGGELGVSLGRDRIAGMERSVRDDSGREPGDRRARAYSDASGNLTGSAIGDGGGSEDGKIFSRAEGLRPRLSCECSQRGEDEENSGAEPKTE